MIKTIIGLGNPGPRFENTRHNIGFMVLDQLAAEQNQDFNSKNNYLTTCIKLLENNIELIKPVTFMNNSGEVLKYLYKKGVKPEEIIVIHDELEKSFGKVSSRLGGSARGHNGLRSLIQFGAENCWRVRCGIGRPAEKYQAGDYVLQRFKPEENTEELVEEAIKEINKIVEKENG